MQTRKRLSALMVLVGLLVGLMPLMAMGQEQTPPNQCFAKVETHDWVRYRVQKSVFATGDPYNNGQGAGAAYWVGEGSSEVTSHSPLTIEPLGNHDAERIVGVSRFNVTSGSNYVASPTGTYFYKLVATDNKTQPTKPAGDGWIDLGGQTVNGEPIPCIEISVSSECGVVFGSVVTNNTPFGAGVRGVIGTDLPPLANWQTESFSLAGGKTFEEDFNGGSVVVTVFAVGPEQDYYAVNGVSAIFKTITVNTDCEEPPPPVCEFDPQLPADDPNCQPPVEDTDFICVDGEVIEVEDGTEGASETREEGEVDCEPTTDTTPVDPSGSVALACDTEGGVVASLVLNEEADVTYSVQIEINGEDVTPGLEGIGSGSFPIEANEGDLVEVNLFAGATFLDSAEFTVDCEDDPAAPTTPSTLAFTGEDGEMGQAGLIASIVGALLLTLAAGVGLARRKAEDI